jgi:hypothetical protein
MILSTLDLAPSFLSRDEYPYGSTVEWIAFDASASQPRSRNSRNEFADDQQLSPSSSAELSLGVARVSSMFESAQKELERYRRYSLNWDGYGAAPFDPSLLAEFSDLLCASRDYFLLSSRVPSLVTTGPASDGSLDLEIETDAYRILLTKYPGESQARIGLTTSSDSNEHTVAFRAADLARWFAGLDCQGVLPRLFVANQGDS